MASTDLIVYLNYMATWDGESDENIDSVISEHQRFVNLGTFDSDGQVNEVFKNLSDLAMDIRDRTIAADATQIAADAAAVSAIWSFGLGMAAFAVLEASEVIQKNVISSKATELNKSLRSADDDISTKISDKVKQYVAAYKANNELIASKAPAGLDTRTCRSLLLQFISVVERNNSLTVSSFKKYAESARRVYNSNEIKQVYDALDKLNFSERSDADVKTFVDSLKGFTFDQKEAIFLVYNFSIGIMARQLKIANDTIKAQAQAAEIPVEEVDATAFETLEAVGKFVTVIVVILSVVDTIFEILDIVDVVDQCKKMCDKLNGTIKQSYLDYFNGIKTASIAYKAAISGQTAPPTQPLAPNIPESGSKIRLRSWKGDYLHRPDSPQGVTTWNTGIGNEWIVERENDKFKFRSWKGDYLHRPDTPQGVTTWNTGVGNDWSIEKANSAVKLKSWKGDYLHRPDSPQGVTTWNTGIGNEWNIEII